MEEQKPINVVFDLIEKDESILAKAGIMGTKSDLGRFIAKFNSAKNLSKIEFNNTSYETANEYSELLKLVMYVSALESYLIFTNKLSAPPFPYHIAEKLFQNDKFTEFVNEIREIEWDMEFYNFIKEKSNRNIAHLIDKYQIAQDINLIYLITGVRHIFVHGLLTPNVRSSNPHYVAQIVAKLNDAIKTAISLDFDSKINSIINKGNDYEN